MRCFDPSVELHCCAKACFQVLAALFRNQEAEVHDYLLCVDAVSLCCEPFPEPVDEFVAELTVLHLAVPLPKGCFAAIERVVRDNIALYPLRRTIPPERNGGESGAALLFHRR